MDENKQIEEITKTMCEEYDTDICKNECQLCGDCANKHLAKKLYNAGYRKADDVIDRLMNAKDTSEITEKELEFFVKHNEKVRKETVREFVEKLKNKTNTAYYRATRGYQSKNQETAQTDPQPVLDDDSDEGLEWWQK